MTEQQEAEFVEQAFEKLKERGWFADQDLERSKEALTHYKKSWFGVWRRK